MLLLLNESRCNQALTGQLESLTVEIYLQVRSHGMFGRGSTPCSDCIIVWTEQYLLPVLADDGIEVVPARLLLQFWDSD